MAFISIGGFVVGGRNGGNPVTLKEFKRDNGKVDLIANFSVVDRSYVYSKPGEDPMGQFYNVEVRGPLAQLCADRLEKGHTVKVDGQQVQRMYNDKLYLDVKNAQITFLERRQQQESVAF